MTDPFQLGFQPADFIGPEEVLDAFESQQGVCGHNLRLQFRQGQNAEVGLFRIDGLIHDKGYEEPQFGDLAGDGLNINSVQAIFDEIELAAVIVIVACEGPVNRQAGLFARRGTVEGIQRRFLAPSPTLVFRVELLQDMNQLLKQTHREGPGTACRIEGFQSINRIDERLAFFRSKVMAFLLPSGKGM